MVAKPSTQPIRRSATLVPQHATRNTQHATRNTQHATTHHKKCVIVRIGLSLVSLSFRFW